MSPSQVRWMRRGAVAVVALLVAGFAVGSLAGGGGGATQVLSPKLRREGVRGLSSRGAPGGVAPGSGYDDSATGLAGAPSAPVAVAEPAPGQAPPAGGKGVPGLGLPPLGSAVIKTGDVGIEVRRGGIDRAFNRVVAIAGTYGGFVLSSSQGGPGPIPLEGGATRPDIQPVPPPDDDGSFTEIVIRIPADRFERAVADLTSGELGKVTRRGFSGQDVSQEFVDLESRLRHLRAQEAVLLKLMAKARSIGDTLVVQQQLSQVQLQIEEITGRLRYLKNQTAFGTIAVHLSEVGAVVKEPSDGPSWSKAWETALEGLGRMGTAALIGATWLAPFALLAAAALGARRWRARPAAQA